jgi:4'-phosphopantetheinyl transferase
VKPAAAWAASPTEPWRGTDEAHVWCASLDPPGGPSRALARTLSSEESSRADRFRFPRDRDRFIVGRGLLRAILGRYLGMEPERIEFRYGPRGKPALSTVPGVEGLRFNLSHSQGLALFALTRDREIGVDLEFIRPLHEVEGIADRFFSPREVAEWRALRGDQRRQAFFNCWTRKEAYLKATGDGLAVPLDGFDVSLAPGKPARLRSVAALPREASRWWLCELAPPAEWAAALAVEGGACRVRYGSWSGDASSAGDGAEPPSSWSRGRRDEPGGAGRRHGLQGGRESRGAVLDMAR